MDYSCDFELELADFDSFDELKRLLTKEKLFDKAKIDQFRFSPINHEYKKLLSKYIKHVINSNGDSFINNTDFKNSNVKFTNKEIKVLNELK